MAGIGESWRRIAGPSIGGRKSVITPVTRAEEVSADCSTTVESQSWPGSASRIFTS